MTNRDRLELLVLAALWGCSFLFMRVAVPEFGPIALVEIRVSVAALFLLAVLLWQGRARLRDMLTAAKPLTFVGAINSALPFTLFAYAAYHLTAGTAAVVPVFGMLWDALFLDEAITVNMIVAGAVILLGTALATGTIRFSPEFLRRHRDLQPAPALAPDCATRERSGKE